MFSTREWLFHARNFAADEVGGVLLPETYTLARFIVVTRVIVVALTWRMNVKYDYRKEKRG